MTPGVSLLHVYWLLLVLAVIQCGIRCYYTCFRELFFNNAYCAYIIELHSRIGGRSLAQAGYRTCFVLSFLCGLKTCTKSNFASKFSIFR